MIQIVLGPKPSLDLRLRFQGLSNLRTVDMSLTPWTDLDFLDTVKLVNYIRSEVKTGNQKPDVSSKSLFEDDSFLKPVLEDDALLYNLDDLADEPSTQGADVGNSAAEKRISELQEDLERLQGQFTNYRLAVQKTMNDQLLAADETISSSSAAGRDLGTKGMTRTEEVDADYFTSYSYNGLLPHRFGYFPRFRY